MGTELPTEMTSHTVKQFWGGDHRGVCLQITAKSDETGPGYIVLTMEEAAALCNNLGDFISIEAKRRQDLLKDQLRQLKIAERTVFTEVAALSSDLLTAPRISVALISNFCPKAPLCT